MLLSGENAGEATGIFLHLYDTWNAINNAFKDDQFEALYRVFSALYTLKESMINAFHGSVLNSILEDYNDLKVMEAIGRKTFKLMNIADF